MLIYLKNLLYSTKTSSVLFVLLGVLYAIATFIEHIYDTATARLYFYNNPIVYFLLLLGAINLLAVLTQRRYFQFRKTGMLIFHAAFVLILVGAWITRSWGYEGIMHIREGESANRIYISANQQEIRQVPFSVKLNDFTIHRYPGSQSPSSFESDIEIVSSSSSRQEVLAMNKVVHEQGYRLYQSSYDPDEKGSVLLVNYDPVGSSISYIGYYLMFAGIIWLLCSKGSRFGLLRMQLKRMATCLMLLIPLSHLHAQPTATDDHSRFLPTAAHAEKFSQLTVQCTSGRTEPANTYTSKLLRKIYRDSKFKNHTADQVVLGLILYPDYWNTIPLVAQENPDIHTHLGTSGKHIPYYALFDTQGDYKLDAFLKEIHAKPPKERNKFDKDILKLDERVNIIFALQQGNYLALFPNENDTEKRWYSPGEDLSTFNGRDSLFVSKIFSWYLSEVDHGIQQNDWQQADEILAMITTYQQAKGKEALISEKKMKSELLYNRLRIFERSAILYLAFSTFLLLFVLLHLFKTNRVTNYLIKGCCFALIGIFAFHTFGIAQRWYISGQAPWANAYESMVYVAWTAVLAGLFFMRRSPLSFGLASLLAGFILLVTNFNFMDPEITPLVPVLKSPWLMIHVAVIMASYGFFGMSFLMSLFSMIASLGTQKQELTQKLREMRIMNEMSLIIGLCLLSAGTFLGAIWANESWGRYWGWDPKEVWALITMLVYAFVVHSHHFKSLRSDFAFHTLTLIAFASVLMTYFGVNYFLSGLHSYGRTDSPGILNIIYGVYAAILILIAVVYTHQKRKVTKRVTQPVTLRS